MRKKSAIMLALEAAHSYDVGMTIPPDPITGLNKAIEINPAAAKRLQEAAKELAEHAPHALHAIDHKDPRMAHTEYLTEVGYHGKTAGGLATESFTVLAVGGVVVWGLLKMLALHEENSRVLKPIEKLEQLEKACQNLKSDQAKAMIDGKLPLPAAVVHKLVELTKEHHSWSMLYEHNQANYQLLAQAMKMPYQDGWGAECWPDIERTDELITEIIEYLDVMEPHVPVMRKFKRLVVGKPVPEKLAAEVTSEYKATAEALKEFFYKTNGNDYIGFEDQGNGYPFGYLDNGDGLAISDLMENQPERYQKYLKRLEVIQDTTGEFCIKWGWKSEPYNTAQFLLAGRILVLETALEVEKGNIKLSTESFAPATPKGPRFSPQMLSIEELAAHQLENVKRLRENEAEQLAELTHTLIDQEPAIAKLVQLCSEGILKNLGGINEVLHGIGLAQYTPGPYELLYSDAKYPARISAALDERGELYNVLGTALSFIDRIKGSAVLDLVSGGDHDALRAALDSIDCSAFSSAASQLPNLETYTDSSIDEFFETIAGRTSLEPHQWEAAFVGARSQFNSLKSISYVARTTLENFTPNLFFQYLNRYEQETADKLRVLGQYANKAVRLLERGAFETMELIESQARQNVRETIKLLERCQMIRKAPSAGMAMESFKADYATQSIGKIEHNEAAQEALKSSFFWGSGKAKQTKVRESRKSSKERLNSGLQSELAEYLAKAIAKYSHVEDLRDLHYVGLVNEGAKYTRIANAVGIRGYDHNRWWSEYTKVQATFTDFSLDFFIQAGTQKSYVNSLLKEIVVFTQTFHSSDNVKTVVDAYNGTGNSHESPEEVARRVVRRFHDYNLVGKFESDHITSAKDVVKVKNRYNVQLLEEVAGALDEFEGRVGYSLRDIYTIYQILCWHLHGADSVASHLMGSNRPLAMEFMVLRDTLVAIADVLVHALYTYNSLYVAHGNRLLSQILFVDAVLEV